MPNPGQPTIAPGATGDAVRRLQRALRRTPDLGLSVDGVFGPKTETAVKGFQQGTGLAVDYRERSPLIVPPNRNLPPPQSVPKRPAEWPVDPDIKRREDSASRKKLERHGYDEDHANRALMPSAPPSGSQASGNRKAGEDEVDQSGGEATNLAPSQLGYFGGLFSWSGFGFGEKEEYGTFKKEPPRRSLTEPPIGYQTPSPAQPYGIGKSTPRPTATPRDPTVGDVGSN